MSGSRSGRVDVWRRLIARVRLEPAAKTSVVILSVIVLLAIVGPLLSPYAYDAIDLPKAGLRPTLAERHWFGTDSLGRDVFARVFVGVRISLLVGVLATAISLVIGVAYGAIAGYLGGRTDAVMMRFVDILFALPFMFFFILLMTLFGGSLMLVLLAIAAVEWLTMARIVRGQTLSIKQVEYVEAAVAAGASTTRILKQHIIPNALGPVIAYATLMVPQVILIESFLSFLGLGVQEPTSLGRLIADGAVEMESRPWLLLFPALLLAVILLCLQFIGEGLRTALDPRNRR